VRVVWRGSTRATTARLMTDGASGPADRIGWTARSFVAGAVVVEVAVLVLAAPTLLRAVGIDKPAAGCGCGAGGTAIGWLAAAAVLVVPLLAVAAMAMRQRAQRRAAVGRD
jgi:hypothetical protein